jgi:hypothetical protein
MTGDAMIAEGRRLARPCVHLRPTGRAARAAAVWRGPGLVPPPGDGYEHWLSIDCRFLPAGAGPPSGCLSVYTENGDRYGAVTHDPAAVLSPGRGGRLLYAHPAESLPPLEAVFLRGSPAVAAWLASLGWPADWGWNGNFPDAGVAEVYHEAQRAGLPIDGSSVFAVLGGWPVPWPDGDWPELADLPLLVLTLAESEPWVEAFRVGDGYRVIQRVS